MGETIVGTNFSTYPGGKGANQAVACGKLGGNVKMIGCIGSDFYNKLCIENLKNSNVDTCGITFTDSVTGVAVITVCDGDNFIILEPGANNLLTFDIVTNNKDLFEWADYLILQLEIPIDTILPTVKFAKEHNIVVILNPAPAKLIDKNIFKFIDILVPNQHEVEQILNCPIKDVQSAMRAIPKLLDLGVKTVIITLGELGCVYNYNEDTYYKEAIKVKPVDTTGAGDSFIGALSVGLSKGLNIHKSIDLAIKTSGITVTRHGASISIPTINEVDSWI